MKLSLIFLVCSLLALLSHADQNDDEFDLNSCPTARRLLFFGGLTFPLVGGKKSDHVSSSSSPPKYARGGATHGLTVYIRPQTSSELGHKVRSYSHLLKSKLYNKEERAKLKKLKKSATKKKDTAQAAPKTRDLVAVNDQERDRCRALLQIDDQSSLIPAKQKKQIKKVKNSISTKVKNATEKAKKQVAKAAKALPVAKKVKAKKEKAPAKEKVKPTKNKEKIKTSETTALTPAPPVVKQKAPPPPPASSPPPPPSPPPPSPTKSKRERAAAPPPPPPKVVEQSADSLDETEQDEIENEGQNNSVVGRAYSFVKNMFQLSDDILENNHTHEEDSILSSPNEPSNRQSRKLLSIMDDFSLFGESIIKRQLLSVKATKHSTPAKSAPKKERTGHSAAAKKPKVGWAYRYRISRYLADQKPKRAGQSSKASPGGGRGKQQAKVAKRKLLAFDSDYELELADTHKSNPEILNTVAITQQFVPKRQLLGAKKVEKRREESDAEQSDEEKASERRRLKSYEDITDPAEIVRSYDRGLFKPRVGWQFRYRVSRYIDSLRQNIREDQERLKLGLQAIKRKTPQELSGRRKRVLDKPFAPEPAESPDVVVQDNKPNVGWRYRYRISKMQDAKQRGEYVDDEELKRQTRLGQKQKAPAQPSKEDDECIEWEFDLDPELRKISEEGKRVGWAYRYRIRRKLDELKQRQAETGVPFNLETLGGKREKKVTPATASAKVTSEEKPVETNKKAVGWQYRYRVSKMLEAQKHESKARSSKAEAKKHEPVPSHERLDPTLARLKPEERVVGWAYRYRIRRKLDALKNASRETGAGRRGKKDRQLAGKGKNKEELIKKVEESIEKILNIDDIDETPFMEYFRRASSYVLFGLVPSARKSVCLLAAPGTFTFCDEEESGNLPAAASTTTQPPKVTATKKLRTKKEKQAKQFIHSRPTKLESVDELIDQPVKSLSKVPKQVAKKPKVRPTGRRASNEQVRHFDEEEQPVKKRVGVESKKKNRKRFQLIGQEVKVKPKHTTPAPTTKTTPSPPPPSPPPTTTAATPKPQPVPTTTLAPPTPQVIRTTSSAPPVISTTTTTTSAPPVSTTTTTIATATTSAPLRTIAEIIQEEAATVLSTATPFTEETKEEINEAQEIAQSTPATSSAPASAHESDDDDDSDDDDGSDEEENSEEEESSGSDNDSNEETKEQAVGDDDFDPLAVKKMKKMYESAKESVHGVFDLKDGKDSS